MTEKKKALTVLILNGVTALIWIALCIAGFVEGEGSVLMHVLRFLCALIWCAAFGASLYRYRNCKEDSR